MGANGLNYGSVSQQVARERYLISPHFSSINLSLGFVASQNGAWCSWVDFGEVQRFEFGSKGFVRIRCDNGQGKFCGDTGAQAAEAEIRSCIGVIKWSLWFSTPCIILVGSNYPFRFGAYIATPEEVRVGGLGNLNQRLAGRL